ncbi:hypothetical protein JCM19232_6260 [Vibrio ishigakensis]|uniref:KfrA N-terminal DNA-binding domain-containing protein n=1 Tax=Vibrio ishigakensis TaxID=1481914 RepID=A0A0B8P588_9VIBR|nr:hypothetical protein [Vibrio ishigakensis]GAM55731.1 hypothetical protein JCM19231_2333 [Vibrio ishigakensis]GAM61955.1 hypothetical protein JCM19232_6260 [Vibrio ishigakensis]
MLTKEVTQELNQIFTSLEAEGKEPSMALVKARLSTTVPMPALITAIKNWKSSKRVPKIEVAAEQTISADERIAKLEATIEKLTARIEALEKQQ